MVTARSATEAKAGAVPEMTFADLLRANQSMVFSLAYHFLRDAGAAEEVAQDVFLRLHGKLSGLEDTRHVTFWLRKVTSNCCIDYARKRASQSTIALDDVAEPSISDQQGDPLLNRRLRQLIGLRYQEDLTPEEISEVLEMPVRTVKSHLQRSLGMLRQKIDRSMGDIR
jgi:RNA polymerase sigma-70 factor, ECF subfamily